MCGCIFKSLFLEIEKKKRERLSVEHCCFAPGDCYVSNKLTLPTSSCARWLCALPHIGGSDLFQFQGKNQKQSTQAQEEGDWLMYVTCGKKPRQVRWWEKCIFQTNVSVNSCGRHQGSDTKLNGWVTNRYRWYVPGSARYLCNQWHTWIANRYWQ